MSLSPQTRRAWFILFVLVILGGGLWGLLFAFQGSLVFYYTPQDLVGKEKQVGKTRLGGIVKEGSFKRNGTMCRFRLTDHVASLEVVYLGLLPSLFREGREVVLEGIFDPHAKVFYARQVLIRHDEVYAPSSSCKPSLLPRNPEATR